MGALAKIELAVSERSKRDFYYRPESVGDKGVIEQIFQNQDYELGHFRLTERLMRLGETESRRGRELLIIDAGANIGAAALYFSFSFSIPLTKKRSRLLYARSILKAVKRICSNAITRGSSVFRW